MKIIRRKSDNIVLFARPDLAWENGSMVCQECRAPGVKEADHDLLDVPDLPADWRGGDYTYDGITWAKTAAAQARDLEEKKSAKLTALTALRRQKEYAGIVVDGATVKTTLSSQAKINGTYCAILQDPTRVIDFKAVSGWVQLDATAITAIAQAVADHVQACYTREKELMAAVEADPDTDITVGWPA